MLPRFKKIIVVSFSSATITIAVFYVLACFAPALNSGRHTYLAMLGLIFPLLLFIMLTFLIYLLIKKSKWAFVCIAILLLGYKQVAVMFSFNTYKKFDVSKTAATLRVLSWNLSGWGETSREYKNNLDAMVKLIKSTDADVLCLQEYLYYKDEKYRDTIITALKEMGYQYIFFAKKDYGKGLFTKLRITGIEIMSKYPITNTAQFIYNENDITEPLIYADIKINNKLVRFFTTHLESVRFELDDYEGLHGLKNPFKTSIQQSRATGGKLKYAYKKRALQAELLHEKIEESPYPVIVCGDFNDVPNSYTYFTIKGNLQDAFLKKGSGFGRTFRFISPTLRIDYILADKKFTVRQFYKFEVDYSDHYPIVSDIDILEKN